MKSDRVFGLGGRVAAVIGAGSGIGEAVAHGCARQGATVRCLDVNGDAAGATADAIAAAGARPMQPGSTSPTPRRSPTRSTLSWSATVGWTSSCPHRA